MSRRNRTNYIRVLPLKRMITQLLLHWICWTIVGVAATPSERQFMIGGIFGETDFVQQAAFHYTIAQFNNDRGAKSRIRLNGYGNMQSLRDMFMVRKEACNLLALQAVAILGPEHEPGLEETRSLCELKELAHLTTGQTSFSRELPLQFSLNLQPPSRVAGKALAAVIRQLNWDSFVFLYQDDEGHLDDLGLTQMQDVFQFSVLNKRPKVDIRRLSAKKDFLPLLKEIREVLEEFHIVVQADISNTRSFIKQAVEFGMFTDYYHYIFTDLDLFTLDLSPYKEEFPNCNVTGVRLIDIGSSVADELRLGLQEAAEERPLVPVVGVQTTAGIVHDSVMVVATALEKIGDFLASPTVSCGSAASWKNGSDFMNYLIMTDINGATGRINFDANGERTNYELTVIELSKSGFEELGRWNESHGLRITKSYSRTLMEGIQSLENRTLIVTVYKEEPFVMLKESDTPLYGNDRYEGYCIDLLNEIASIRHFNYTLREVKDNSYGAKDENGRWTGMIGELVRGEADLALASLTISYSRSEVIDFTVPYMHLGISILFKKPEKKDPNLFTFLSPLSLDVWIYMLAAYLGVSLMLWVLARFSPYEWFNPQPCNRDTDVVENQFSLLNSLWFTVGSLMQQGSDISPRAASTRLVAGIWWFFTLIIIQSYTANLAAFLTVERMVSPIESTDDLAKQTRIKYGSLGRGSTMTFFKESKIQTYERMWSFMESTQPSVFVNSSKEGIQRVKQGDYAYLMESSMLEYYIERDCDLMQIGGLLDSKGYGIGLPKGSPFRDPISSAILMLQERTILTALKEKWWKQKRGGGQCKGDDQNKGQPGELALANVGGVFVLLLGGLLLAFLIAVGEFVYKARHNCGPNRRSLCTEIWEEFKFVLSCRQAKKPSRKKLNSIAIYNSVEQENGKATVVPSYSYIYNTLPTKLEPRQSK